METKKKPRGKPFAPGNPGGPGRPRREVEREYLSLLQGQVTKAAWVRIVDRALKDAETGEGSEAGRARDWLAKFLVREAGHDDDESDGAGSLEATVRKLAAGRHGELQQAVVALPDDLRDALGNAMQSATFMVMIEQTRENLLLQQKVAELEAALTKANHETRDDRRTSGDAPSSNVEHTGRGEAAQPCAQDGGQAGGQRE